MLADFNALGIEIPARRGNARVVCPRCADAHNNRKKTLSCDIERGIFQCFRCGWKGRVGGDIAWTDYKPAPSALETHRRKRQYAIDCILSESVTITHSSAQPARTYLSRRMGRILGEYPNLRFHPAARYYQDGEHKGDYPALISEVRDINNRLVTLHRTYLTEDGHKAPLDPPRKLMGVPQGSCSGVAIRLAAASDALVLCEGIETALALSLMLDTPAWAAISAHGLETVVIPNSVKTIHIGADNDTSGTGQRAARRLANRLWDDGYRDIVIHTPDGAGDDWADVVKKGMSL